MGLQITPDYSNPEGYQLSAIPPGWCEKFVARDVLERKEDDGQVGFRAVRRSDDLLVLSTGLKFSNSELEARLVREHSSIVPLSYLVRNAQR